MDLSISLAGMQTADAAFNASAAAIIRAFNSGPATQSGNASNQGDTLELSSAVAGLLSSRLAFMANEKAAIVEDSMMTSTLSVVG